MWLGCQGESVPNEKVLTKKNRGEGYINKIAMQVLKKMQASQCLDYKSDLF